MKQFNNGRKKLDFTLLSLELLFVLFSLSVSCTDCGVSFKTGQIYAMTSPIAQFALSPNL